MKFGDLLFCAESHAKSFREINIDGKGVYQGDYAENMFSIGLCLDAEPISSKIRVMLGYD